MDYSYKITTHGRAVQAACMDLQKPLKLTRAAVGSGLIPEEEDLADRHELVQYVSEAAIADRRHEGDRLILTVRYSNQNHPETKTFTLSEFMVWAEDPETGQETDYLYATLGDHRQPVPAYSTAFPASVWSFPLVLVLSGDLEVSITASPGLATFEDLLDLKTALSTKAAKSAQDTVEAKSVPSRTVTVAAADLAAYIAALPRLLTEDLTVSVTGGTTDDKGISIVNFYGPGGLALAAAEGAEVAVRFRLMVRDCSVPIALDGFRFEGASNAATFLDVENAAVTCKHAVIDRSQDARTEAGVSVHLNGIAVLVYCEIKNTYNPLYAEGGTIIAHHVKGSNNTVGAIAYPGGIVFLGGTTEKLVGGASNTKNNGIIIYDNELV